MPRTVFFYNNVGPLDINGSQIPGHSDGTASTVRNISLSKSRDGNIIKGTPEERSIHINAELIGDTIPGITIKSVFINPFKVRRRRMVWGGGFIRNKRVLWDGKGVQTSSERIDILVRQHINY